MERREFIAALAAGAALELVPRPASAVEGGLWTERVRPLMGTYVSIAAFTAERSIADELITQCFEYLEQKISLISNWDDQSCTSELNDRRELIRSKATELIASLLLESERVRAATGGLFNTSVLALTKLWREAKQAGSIPAAGDIRWAQRRVQASRSEVRHETIKLYGDSGTDFDGIGKGLIADLGAMFLQTAGVRFARVACSGDIRFIGNTSWVVEVQDPRSEGMLGELHLYGNCAVSTSGDYRNSWIVNGNRYHHLIDPRTGMPGRACMQATIVASSCMLSDALSSATFFLAPEQVERLLKAYPAAMAVIVDSHHRTHHVRNSKISKWLEKPHGGANST